MPPFQPRPSDPLAAADLARQLGIHPVTAQVLAGRGITQEGAARSFLQPGAAQLHDPWLFAQMGAAIDRIEKSVRGKEPIVVYGDYDVDGVCATTVLLRTLRLLGAEATPFIPHRVDDGYGLSGDALDRLAEDGCALVVTVDNGTTRAAEIARAAERGLAVVVTDHHEAAAALPACPLINPKCDGSGYPFPALAGCGVALKVALALADRFGRMKEAGFRALLPDLLATVAIGTVADVMPLRDENRSLVAMGLKALTATEHPGLRALMKVARVDGREARTPDIAFRLGPRINAAGRIGDAGLALELLLCDDPDEAARLASRLDQCNKERQKIERKQADEAFEQAQRRLADRDQPALVLSREGWHPGVIGIVAARLTESFGKPAVLITVDGDEARGSARSFGAARLHEALERCAEHLTTHGGHARAAGFTLDPKNIDAFRAAFVKAVAEQELAPAGPRTVDAELPIDAISAPLAKEIDSLQPFGLDNEEPLFCAFGVRAAGQSRRTGHGEKHVTFFAASERSSVKAVAYHELIDETDLSGRFDIAFVLRRRAGPEPVEIQIRELVPAAT